jgi:hypothetical protein
MRVPSNLLGRLRATASSSVTRLATDQAGKAEVDSLLARGEFIHAVRRVRELTGLRLIDARRLVGVVPDDDHGGDDHGVQFSHQACRPDDRAPLAGEELNGVGAGGYECAYQGAG